MVRVPYVGPDELDDEFAELVVSSLQPGKRINIYSATANNPEILAGLRTYLGSMWADSGLSDRQREIIILTAAAEIRSGYEWHQHEAIGTNAGLSHDEIAAIARDEQRVFPEEDQKLIAYTRAVIRGRVTDALHDEIEESLGPAATVGAAATASGYLALGRMIDAFAVELEEGDTFVGWDPR